MSSSRDCVSPEDHPEPDGSQDELIFDLSLKKGKKSFQKNDSNDDVEATSPAKEEFSELMNESNKAKKSTNKDTESRKNEMTPADDATINEEDFLSELKKKKKKKKAVEEAAAATTEDAEIQEVDDGLEELTLGKKKKSIKKPGELPESDEIEEKPTYTSLDYIEGEEPWLSSNRDYTYQELLHRVFRALHQNNPELAGEKKKYTIAPPQVFREGKKTIFFNITDICRRMHRQPEHLIQFIFAELGTSGSVDGSQRLVIKGRYQSRQLENLLRKYIVEYVACKTCKSLDTILTKENRLFFQQCEACGSTRSVATIKTGFKAQTERRAAQRAAATV